MFIAENVSMYVKLDKQLTWNESESKMRTGINKVFKWFFKASQINGFVLKDKKKHILLDSVETN